MRLESCQDTAGVSPASPFEGSHRGSSSLCYQVCLSRIVHLATSPRPAQGQVAALVQLPCRTSSQEPQQLHLGCADMAVRLEGGKRLTLGIRQGLVANDQ